MVKKKENVWVFMIERDVGVDPQLVIASRYDTEDDIAHFYLDEGGFEDSLVSSIKGWNVIVKSRLNVKVVEDAQTKKIRLIVENANENL